MKKIFILIFATVSLFANDFDLAIKDYEKGDYVKALNTFYMLAKNDDAKAQYNVGFIYANGLGVEKNLMLAQQWYEKAAKQGNGAAQYNLAQLYQEEGQKDAHAYEKAKYWYEKAIEAEIKDAYTNLGVMYLEGLGVEKNQNKAFGFFEKGASLGDGASQVNLAVLYAWGEGVTHDKMKAYEYLKKALQSGQSKAGEYLDLLCKESAWVCKN